MSQQIRGLLANLEHTAVATAEKGLVPDSVIRIGVRTMLKRTLDIAAQGGDVELQQQNLEKFIKDVSARNIAEQTKEANEQHYEVPTELYLLMLGPWLKYSSGLWPTKKTTLEESEVEMLELVCKRSELDTLAEGSTVLDLGCGWGSFALYVAKKYPKLNITCISNSNTQREFILSKAKELGIKNLTPQTSDINVMEFDPATFDRVCSTEMFEHMKNYQKLLKKISSWLKPSGKLFVHMFTHKRFSYHFEKGWMTDNFFSGGTMPGQGLLARFSDDLKIEEQWAVNGVHYSKTLEAWLEKIDNNKAEFLKICTNIYGKEGARKWLFNWRLFHISCSECFKMNDGNEWFVSHYRFIQAKQ